MGCRRWMVACCRSLLYAPESSKPRRREAATSTAIRRGGRPSRSRLLRHSRGFLLECGRGKSGGRCLRMSTPSPPPFQPNSSLELQFWRGVFWLVWVLGRQAGAASLPVTITACCMYICTYVISEGLGGGFEASICVAAAADNTTALSYARRVCDGIDIAQQKLDT